MCGGVSDIIIMSAFLTLSKNTLDIMFMLNIYLCIYMCMYVFMCVCVCVKLRHTAVVVLPGELRVEIDDK